VIRIKEEQHMRRTIAFACAAAALAAPAAAQGHLTLQPDEQPAGGFARLDVRVPNEREDASTTRVEVKFPPGFAEVSTEPVPGWTAKVTKRGIAEVVDSITWTGDGRQGAIRPGRFQDFGVSLALPDRPGASLTFKALQTYAGGEVVRWTGPPDAEQPAPRVKLTAAVSDDHGAAGDDGAETLPAAGVEATSGGDGDGAPTWLGVLALAAGAVGLAAGVGALAAARRRPA
jgi:periplasmic copper chaperone A